jgi:mono/diheme cytochrome c family protein
MFATELTLFDHSQANNVTVRILILVGVLLLCCSNAYADIEHGKRIYRENCAPCHGESGKGDGAGARSLPVRPADHTNPAVMNARTDAFLRDVIAKGGNALGLSSFMPAWQGIFKDDEIQDLVGYIRSLALPAK